MILNCYKCKTDTLEPALLSGSLETLRCKTCKGVHIGLLDYKEWLDEQNIINTNNLRAKKVKLPEDFNFEEVENTDGALICQSCGKYTIKYHINNEVENTINVCNSCKYIWLDKGEWQLLKFLNMHNKLTQVINDAYQKHLKELDSENDLKELYKQKLGEDFSKTEEFAQWLIDKPNKFEILHYLTERRI